MKGKVRRREVLSRWIIGVLLFILFLFAFSPNAKAAVTGKIAGVVVDARTGEPLPAVPLGRVVGSPVQSAGGQRAAGGRALCVGLQRLGASGGQPGERAWPDRRRRHSLRRGLQWHQGRHRSCVAPPPAREAESAAGRYRQVGSNDPAVL